MYYDLLWFTHYPTSEGKHVILFRNLFLFLWDFLTDMGLEWSQD